MIEFPTEVTKEFILSRVSQEEIFEMYGNGLTVTPYMFKSTLRADSRPTCKFYRRNNGQLLLRDYGGHFWGDCFDLVTLQTGKKFFAALEDIAIRFKLITDTGILTNLERVPITPKVSIEPETCKIRVKRRSWTRADLKMWELIGVGQSTLERFRVAPLDRAWVNDNQMFWYGHENEIAFVYHFPEYGEYEYKLYFPSRSEHRFIQANASILQGFHQLPKEGDHCLITKSYKDVISLYEFGVNSCAPMGETIIVSPGEAEDISARFPFVATLYDIDKLAGIYSMQKMRKLYGWTPLFFNIRKGLPKDFTDFVMRSGVADARLLVEYIKEIYL